MHLQECIYQDHKRKFVFELKRADYVLVLAADNNEDMISWLSALRKEK
jgi:hypothetical protein